VVAKRLTEYADCAGCASKLGAAELVTSGVHGYVVPDVTAHAELVGAMRTLATDAAARARMGAAAALLMHEHSWDRVAERTLAVYERHLGARSRS